MQSVMEGYFLSGVIPSQSDLDSQGEVHLVAFPADVPLATFHPRENHARTTRRCARGWSSIAESEHMEGEKAKGCDA